MPVIYCLTPELRIKLEEPIGMLIRGSFSETMSKFKEIIEKEKPHSIISVGDRVSKNLIKNGIAPQLSIVDERCMRKKTQPIRWTAASTIRVKNPQGTITEEAYDAIRKAIEKNERTKIVVDGEEDLLALIAVLHAKDDSLVLYGQPYQGIVVVKVTAEKKSEVAEILKAMEDVRKPK